MDENTVVQDENATISENPAENQATDQQVADQVEEVEQQAEQPTRSERREQNYIDRLSEQIRNSNPRPESREQARQDYKPLQYEEGEYDPQQLEEDRSAYGKSQFTQGVQTAQEYITPVRLEMWADRLETDADRVKQEWSVLDEDSKDFDSEFANEINQKFLNFIGYRKDNNGNVTVERQGIRYRDFVKAERQNIERYASRLNENSTRNIVKQAANTGMRPNAQPRSPKGGNVNTDDPNWISKLSKEEYNEWGRDLADKKINEALGL